MNKFFVYVADDVDHSERCMESFDDEQAAIKFIAQRAAGNVDLKFRVVEGRELIVEPVDVVRTFKLTRTSHVLR